MFEVSTNPSSTGFSADVVAGALGTDGCVVVGAGKAAGGGFTTGERVGFGLGVVGLGMVGLATAGLATVGLTVRATGGASPAGTNGSTNVWLKKLPDVLQPASRSMESPRP